MIVSCFVNLPSLMRFYFVVQCNYRRHHPSGTFLLCLQVALAVRNRTMEMVEALYTKNRVSAAHASTSWLTYLYFQHAYLTRSLFTFKRIIKHIYFLLNNYKTHILNIHVQTYTYCEFCNLTLSRVFFFL